MIDGVVVVDKPAGFTSHDVVKKVKKIFGAKKAGHTGTLDPMATGVLPICLNRATKKSADLMGGDKEYLVEILFGVTTDTFDTEGRIISEKEIPDNIIDDIRSQIPYFTGVIEQKPPYFSAVKHKGRPLYRWAREGKLIDLPPRKVEVKCFKIVGFDQNCLISRIICSKGTYIRSICHDLGQKLGVGACMKGLRRMATGPFHIEDAVTLNELESEKDQPNSAIIDINSLQI